LNHQIQHLHRSQIEIANAILEEPDDKILTEAYNENVDVILNKQILITTYNEMLKNIDPVFQLEVERLAAFSLNDYRNNNNHTSTNLTIIETASVSSPITSEGVYL
jgi:hypothetical protein